MQDSAQLDDALMVDYHSKDTVLLMLPPSTSVKASKMRESQRSQRDKEHLGQQCKLRSKLCFDLVLWVCILSRGVRGKHGGCFLSPREKIRVCDMSGKPCIGQEWSRTSMISPGRNVLW